MAAEGTVDPAKRLRALQAARKAAREGFLYDEAMVALVDAALVAYVTPTEHDAALAEELERRRAAKTAIIDRNHPEWRRQVEALGLNPDTVQLKPVLERPTVTPDQDPADNPQSGESWERDDVPSRAMAPPSVADQVKKP